MQNINKCKHTIRNEHTPPHTPTFSADLSFDFLVGGAGGAGSGGSGGRILRRGSSGKSADTAEPAARARANLDDDAEVADKCLLLAPATAAPIEDDDSM